MKYIKQFENFKPLNENVDNLRYLTDSYLSYLKDNGITFDVTEGKYLDKDSYIIDIELLDDDSFSEFKWSDIKEDFVQYLEMLNMKYDVSLIRIGLNGNGKFIPTREYSIYDLLSDDFDPKSNITILSLIIKK